MKISIEKSAGSLKEPYKHLVPLVEELIRLGNTPVHKNLFYRDRDGWRCDLKEKIDFKALKSKFNLPSTIYFSEESDSILCKDTWIEIKGSCKFDYITSQGHPL